MRIHVVWNLTKEYLKLTLYPYSALVMLWVLILFGKLNYDVAIAAVILGSVILLAAAWKIIFIDSVRGACSGLYQGLPATAAEQRAARILAGGTGILIAGTGFLIMNVMMWEQMEFWGAQYVYNGTDFGSKHYVAWLYERFLEGGGTI